MHNHHIKARQRNVHAITNKQKNKPGQKINLIHYLGSLLDSHSPVSLRSCKNQGAVGKDLLEKLQAVASIVVKIAPCNNEPIRVKHFLASALYI